MVATLHDRSRKVNDNVFVGLNNSYGSYPINGINNNQNDSEISDFVYFIHFFSTGF